MIAFDPQAKGYLVTTKSANTADVPGTALRTIGARKADPALRAVNNALALRRLEHKCKIVAAANALLAEQASKDKADQAICQVASEGYTDVADQAVRAFDAAWYAEKQPEAASKPRKAQTAPIGVMAVPTTARRFGESADGTRQYAQRPLCAGAELVPVFGSVEDESGSESGSETQDTIASLFTVGDVVIARRQRRLLPGMVREHMTSCGRYYHETGLISETRPGQYKILFEDSGESRWIESIEEVVQ